MPFNVELVAGAPPGLVALLPVELASALTPPGVSPADLDRRVGDWAGGTVADLHAAQLLAYRGDLDVESSRVPSARCWSTSTEGPRLGRAAGSRTAGATAGGVVIEHAEDAGNSRHMRLYDALRDRCRQSRIGGVAPGAQDVGTGAGAQWLGADHHATVAFGRLLGAEDGLGEEPAALLWVDRAGCAAFSRPVRCEQRFEDFGSRVAPRPRRPRLPRRARRSR